MGEAVRSTRLGCAGGEAGELDARGRERVVATVPTVLASGALFLDVSHFAVGGHLAIVAGHASTSQCSEPEKTNETHHSDPRAPTLSNTCTDEVSR